MTGAGKRRPRTDALRNRAMIIEVARHQFAEHGIGTSLETSAKDAGVGPGTLYRHFPTRESLLTAALDEGGEELLARHAQIVLIADPDEALRQWMRAPLKSHRPPPSHTGALPKSGQADNWALHNRRVCTAVLHDPSLHNFMRADVLSLPFLPRKDGEQQNVFK